MTTLEWLKHRKGEVALAQCETTEVVAAPDATAVRPEKSPRIPERPIFDDVQINIFLEAEKICDHSTSRIGALGDSRGNIEVSRAENEIARGNIGDSHPDNEIGREFIEDSSTDSQRKPDSVDPFAPHLLADGTLVIPFKSDPKFHWWKGGQSISQTRAECLRTAIIRNEPHQPKESDVTSI